MRRFPVDSERWLFLAASFLQSAVVLILLWLYVHYHPTLGGGRGNPLSALLSRSAASLPNRPGAVVAGEEWLTVVIVAAVLTLVAGVVLRALLRRRDHRGTPLQQLARRLQEALEEGLEELEAEPDPRRAVIAAYARMELSLARVGLPRRSPETALEYLQRLLDMVRLDNPAAARLTDLFQLAKFSDHPIDQAMKRQAIEALAAVRDDLRELASDQPPVVASA